MNTARLLITGANGLIGRILWAPLLDHYDVRGMDLAPPFSDRLVRLDLTDLAQLTDHIKRISPLDAIVHLAGQSSVQAGWDAVLAANIVGTRNLYEAARLCGVRRIIFASSNHVTGAYEGFPPRLHLEPEPRRITVHDPIRPDSDYGVSKAFGEAQAGYYFARFGVESICLRIGSVLADNDPSTDPRFARTWLSHRDLIQLVRKSLLTPVKFGIYYGISNNRGAFWDISNARADLGYTPVDDAGEVLGRAAGE